MKGIKPVLQVDTQTAAGGHLDVVHHAVHLGLKRTWQRYRCSVTGTVRYISSRLVNDTETDAN